MCFTNINYLIAINGKKVGPVIPSRRLGRVIRFHLVFLLWLRGYLYCFKIESLEVLFMDVRLKQDVYIFSIYF